MRARIRTPEFTLEFDGDPAIWNDLVRPVLGGPQAPAAARPAARQPAPDRRAQAAPPAAPPESPAPAPAPPASSIQPSSDPRELYGRLRAAGGRRSEKDAVVAAVWFVAGADGDATPEEVQQHLIKHGEFGSARVKPVMLKHVSRSRLLEKAERKGAVRLTQKGRQYVQERLVGANA